MRTLPHIDSFHAGKSLASREELAATMEGRIPVNDVIKDLIARIEPRVASERRERRPGRVPGVPYRGNIAPPAEELGAG